MELRFARSEDNLSKLWKGVFPDDDGELFFANEYNCRSTLVYDAGGGCIVSSLHWILQDFSLWGEAVKCAYILGVATAPEYRRRGLAGDLIEQALFELHLRKVPLALLIPADPAMADYYAHYGFRKLGLLQRRVERPKGGRPALRCDIPTLNRHYESVFSAVAHALRPHERWSLILDEYDVEVLPDGYVISDRGRVLESTAAGAPERHPGGACVRVIEARDMLALAGRRGRPVPQTVYDEWCPWNIIGGLHGDEPIEDALFERGVYANLLHN